MVLAVAVHARSFKAKTGDLPNLAVSCHFELQRQSVMDPNVSMGSQGWQLAGATGWDVLRASQEDNNMCVTIRQKLERFSQKSDHHL